KVEKNENVLNELNKKNAELENQKNKVWKEAWDSQKDLMLWPDDPKQKFKQLDKYPYGVDIDKVDLTLCEMYTQDSINLKQFEDMKSVDEPTNYQDGWQYILNPKDWKKNLGPPRSEDLWIAQEDIWVKRSLLRIVQDANDVVRIFKEKSVPVAERKSPPKG